jgi:hypothetical protein
MPYPTRTIVVATIAVVHAATARAAVAQPPSQPGVVQLRGRVTGPDSQPVPRAVVIASPLAEGASAMRSDSTVTDSLGRYALRLEAAPRYLVVARAPGFQPGRRTVVREGAATSVSGDLALARTAVTLNTVRVQEVRRPTIGEGIPSEVGSAASGASMPITPGDAGNLAAMAATIPGVTLTPGADGGPPGFSVLGLGPTQNAVALNGLSFGGAQVPAAGFTMTRLQTASADPSVGGFSGGLLSLTLFRGSNFRGGQAVAIVEDPALQWTDAAGARLGQQYRNLQVSASRTGPVVRDKLFYNVSAQVGRRASDLAILGAADPAALAAVGVSPASEQQLYTALGVIGAPAPRGGVDQTSTTGGSVLARIDILPTQRRTLNVALNGSWNRVGPSFLGPLALSTQGGRTVTRAAGVQVEHAHYVANRFLSRTRSGVSLSDNETRPTAALPDGRVLVRSTLDDGRGGLATLRFGGASAAGRRGDSRAWETTNETTWYTGRGHQPKVAGGVKLDNYDSEQATNQFGTYTYNSLDDLAAGRPATFTRTLGGFRTRGSALTGWASVGDLWRVTDRLTLQGGVRVEANRYGDVPAYNPVVDSLFGARTDDVPGVVAVSPRLGVTWGYGRQRASGVGSPFGSGQPRGTLRASIGQFRGTLPATLLGVAVNGTGLPDALQRVACVGPAVPAPDWAAYARDAARIPTACAPVSGGVGAPSFADARPPVTLFARGYDATRSWRTNVGWQGRVTRSLALTAEAIYSRSLDQPGTRDLNFAGREGFALPDEGGRPVYVDLARVDPASGAVDPLASRVTPRFSRVSAQTSNLRAESRQLSLRVGPTGGFFVTNFWSLSYAYTQSRDQVRGFDAAAFGDPRVAPWGTGSFDVRHAINASANRSLSPAINVSINGQLRSGAPFTPVVAGDVNGDGVSGNDRAFVFDPATAGDSALATGMRELLRGAPGAVRDCLTRQLGAAAGRNSCRGPWTTTLGATVSIDGQLLRLPRRPRILISVINPLGGLDQLLHGEDGLRGWGQPAAPDPTLLAVRGFDASARRFRYAVNPAFGDARPARSGVRAPFQLALRVSVPTVPPQSRQLLDEVLQPGRGWKGARLTEAQIRQRYQNQGLFNPIRPLLAAKDSLLLTQEQVAEVTAIGRRYEATLDTVWGGLARELAPLPERYDRAALLAKVRAAQSAAWDALEVAAEALTRALTAEQRELIAPEIRSILDPRSLRILRRIEISFF